VGHAGFRVDLRPAATDFAVAIPVALALSLAVAAHAARRVPRMNIASAVRPASSADPAQEPAADSGRPTGMRRLLAIVAVVVLGVLPAACHGPTGPTYVIGGTAVAGPTCPIVPASPLPGQCAARTVPGAILVISDAAAGREVARVTTASDGRFWASLPAGTYRLTPQPVEGLLGVAPPVTFTVSDREHPTDLRVEYDTGIR
jgi:hypothetical protein